MRSLKMVYIKYLVLEFMKYSTGKYLFFDALIFSQLKLSCQHCGNANP
jgi:hypothetical protein